MLNIQVVEINQLCQQMAIAVGTLLHGDITREFRNRILDGQIRNPTSSISVSKSPLQGLSTNNGSL